MKPGHHPNSRTNLAAGVPARYAKVFSRGWSPRILNAKRRATKLYAMYHNMKARCEKPDHKFFRTYGGRGIQVCFATFGEFRAYACEVLREQGGWQRGYSIDRIDNDGNYEEGNIQFLPHSENVRKGST